MVTDRFGNKREATRNGRSCGLQWHSRTTPSGFDGRGPMDTAQAARILRLEEKGLAAWPAFMTVLDDGWVIRLTAGHTKRANSITAIGHSRLALEDKLANAEHLFARHGLPLIFRLTPLAEPQLDTLLAARGFHRAEESVVMTAPLAPGQGSASDVIVAEGVTPEWVEAYARIQNIGAGRTQTLRRMMQLIAAAHATATVRENGDITGFGLAVLDRSDLGLFEILTHPGARRRGIARRIMQALLAWGAAAGARDAYLQVVATNASAISLYADLGFSECYRYWYRLKEIRGVTH
jgi:GNAT superfamily N-acetyltransferase